MFYEFTHLIMDSNALNVLFITVTNLDDTNLVMVNICSYMGRMAHTSHDQNSKITCLNHVTSLCDKQDDMIQIFE
jgi:hypothetical protein